MARHPGHRRALPGAAVLLVVLFSGARPAAADRDIPVTKAPSGDSCDDDGPCGTATLPDGIVLEGGCLLVARRGRDKAVIADLDPSGGEVGGCPALGAVVLGEDGGLSVKTGWSETFHVSRKHMRSRLELAAANRLVKHTQLDKAERALERALSLDPGFEQAAFALARVRVGGGDLDRAAAALAPFVGKGPMRLYGLVLAERALHPLLERQPFAAMRTDKAGTATMASERYPPVEGPLAPLIAWSAERKLFAVVQRRRSSSAFCGACFETNLLVFDGTGLYAVMPIFEEGPATDTREGMKEARRGLSGRLAAANRLLADFGFGAVTDIERATFASRATGSRSAVLPRTRLGIAFRDGFARVLRGDEVLKERQVHKDCRDPKNRSNHLCDYEPTPTWAARIPAANTLLFEWASSGAEGHDIVTVIEVMPLDAPGGRVIMPQGLTIP